MKIKIIIAAIIIIVAAVIILAGQNIVDMIIKMHGG